MYLLNTFEFVLEEFKGSEIPPYAILSHRWISDEVSFSDVIARKFRHRQGYLKFRNTLRRAREDGFRHAWIDTCCIDQRSSADVSEAINSMFRWYRDAQTCYVYLHDVEHETWKDTLRQSVWFTRGWTLQELLAPCKVVLYDAHWQLIGNKVSLVADLSRITGIDQAALETGNLRGYSVAQRMSWAAGRITTRVEDQAYCLIGLFDVNLPPMYGEGERAFLRLQEEIIRNSDDHSIFAWAMNGGNFSGLLAPEPGCFADSGHVKSRVLSSNPEPFMTTNRGLSIKFELVPWSADTYLAYLDCVQEVQDGQSQVGIFLRRLSEDDQYARIRSSQNGLWNNMHNIPFSTFGPRREKRLSVRRYIDKTREAECLGERPYGIRMPVRFLPMLATARSSISRFITLHPGECGGVAVVNLAPECQMLGRIALGFDFDFNPLCLLGDVSEEHGCAYNDEKQHFDWADILEDVGTWELIHGPGNVSTKRLVDGRYAVKGHRLTGLEIILGKSFTNKGYLLRLIRDISKSPPVWEFDLDSLVGPFRNHSHKALKGGYINRCGWQAVWALSMSEKDLEEGDLLLESHFGVVDKTC